MKAMIFAAGHGKRMGVLTQHIPKPLLKVKGQTLLENKILALKEAGISEMVINVAYLGEQIQQFAGDGGRWQVNIQYSEEPYPLETGGGLYRALPLLGDQPFLADLILRVGFFRRRVSLETLSSFHLNNYFYN